MQHCRQVSAAGLAISSHAVSRVRTFTGKLGRAFIHVAVYKNLVKLGFNRGTQLGDPDSLLQGTGKLIRHVRLTGKSDLRQTAIKKLIAAAIEQGRAVADVKHIPSSPTVKFV